jgi:hypothetical protein
LIDSRITTNGWHANIAGHTWLVYTRVAVNIADGTRLVNARINPCCRHTNVPNPTWLIEPRIAIRPNRACIASNPGLIDTAITGMRRNGKGNHGDGDNPTHPYHG